MTHNLCKPVRKKYTNQVTSLLVREIITTKTQLLFPLIIKLWKKL